MNEDRAQMVLVSLLAASEPLSPWDLQCQRAKDKDNRTSRDCFRAGVSENNITCGQGQVCRVSSLLFVGVILFLKIWTNCANCRMLTAASTEPRAPGAGEGHVCGSCVGKAWYTVDCFITRAGWSALENSLPKIFTSGGCQRAQGEVQWIGFKWEKKRTKRKMP